MPARLGAVAAVLHAAPPPGTVAARVDEEPATSADPLLPGAAHFDVRAIPHEQLGSGERDRPEHAAQIVGLFPAVGDAASALDEAAVREGLGERVIEQLQELGLRALSFGASVEDVV